MPILAAVAALFKIWMLVDAMQKGCGRCGNYWLWIILLPLGDVAYFFTVKIHDPEIKNFFRNFTPSKAPNIETLRFNLLHCPSLENKLLLAKGLNEVKNYAENKILLEEILRLDSENKEALFGLGITLFNLNRLEEARVPLLRLTSKDLVFLDYEPALLLVQVYQQLGEKVKALDLARQVYAKSQRLEHALELAKLLIKDEKNSEAEELLKRGLTEYEHSPKFVQRSQRSVAKSVRSFLKEGLQVRS